MDEDEPDGKSVEGTTLFMRAADAGLYRIVEERGRVTWRTDQDVKVPVVWYTPVPPPGMWLFAPVGLDAPSASEHPTEEHALNDAVEYIEAVNAGETPAMPSPPVPPSRPRKHKRVRRRGV